MKIETPVLQGQESEKKPPKGDWKEASSEERGKPKLA